MTKSDPIPSLARVRREAAEEAGRRLLETLHAELGDNVSAIARAAGATRLQVKTYMRRYKIGRFDETPPAAGGKRRAPRKAAK